MRDAGTHILYCLFVSQYHTFTYLTITAVMLSHVVLYDYIPTYAPLRTHRYRPVPMDQWMLSLSRMITVRL